MDKIKIVYVYPFQQHLWIRSKETNPQKWRKQTIAFEGRKYKKLN